MEIRKIAKISGPVDSFEKLYNPGQIIAKEIAGLKEKAEKERAVRIIADHIKAATFILAEGVEPSNVEGVMFCAGLSAAPSDTENKSV